jgi:hypothetical protein
VPFFSSIALLALAVQFEHVGPTPPPHGFPAIRSVYVSSHSVGAGQTIVSRVTTSPNVGYVEARIQNFNQPFTREGLGRFSLSYAVPWWLMPWLRHAWSIDIVARSVDGVETRRSVPITVH